MYLKSGLYPADFTCLAKSHIPMDYRLARCRCFQYLGFHILERVVLAEHTCCMQGVKSSTGEWVSYQLSPFSNNTPIAARYAVTA